MRREESVGRVKSGWRSPLFIGGGDRLGGEGVLKSKSLIVFTVRRVFCTPSPLRGPLPL